MDLQTLMNIERIVAGGPGSGRHADLSKLYDLHDAVRNTRDTGTRYQYSVQKGYLEKLLGKARSIDPKAEDLVKANNHLSKADNLADTGNHKLATAYQDTALALIHRWMDDQTGLPHGWKRTSLFAGGPGSGCRGDNCGRPLGKGAKPQFEHGQTQVGKPPAQKEASLGTQKKEFDVGFKSWRYRATKPELSTKEKGPKGKAAAEVSYKPKTGEVYTRDQHLDEKVKQINRSEGKEMEKWKANLPTSQRAGTPKYNVNDQVKILVPIKVWNEQKSYYGKEKVGVLGEVHKVIPGVAGNPNIYEVYPRGASAIRPGELSEKGEGRGIDMFHLKEDEISMHKAYDPEIGEPKNKRGTVQQQAELPSGAKYSTLKPYTGDKPESKLSGDKPNVINQSTRTWPEQAMWKNGQPSVDRSPLYGKFKQTNMAMTDKAVRPYPKTTTAVFDARYSNVKDSDRLTLFVTRDKQAQSYSVTEQKTDMNRKAGYAKSMAVGYKPQTVKFNSPMAQQIYIQRRYGFNVEKKSFKK